MEEVNNSKCRRRFLKLTTAGAAFAAIELAGINTFSQKTQSRIPEPHLPYPVDALEPYLSRKTLKLHFQEHHSAYYKKLVGYLSVNKEFSSYPLEQLIDQTRGGIFEKEAIFNFAVLMWNHNFYWQSMKPNGGVVSEQKSLLTKHITDTFGSIAAFKNKFIERAMELGIGWVWLIKTADGLKITRTTYHNSPIDSEDKPLVTLDVWEHAYYMDYLDDRQEYVEKYLNNLINWDFAQKNYV